MSEQIPDGEKIKAGYSPQQEIKSEYLELKKEKESAIRKLQDAIDTLFGAKMGGTYAQRNEEGFSGDAASIYVLVSMDEKGEEAPALVKIGWGEFSKKTFVSGKFSAFHNFPFDIYCVSQDDSYFADEKLKKEMIADPIKYITEHSLFAANNGQVTLAERAARTRYLNKKIEAVPYDDMLRTVRNNIIQEQSAQEEFAEFLQGLPDNPVQIGRYMTGLDRDVPLMSRTELSIADEETKVKARKKNLMRILWGMGVDTTGIAVGYPKAMNSVLELKRRFDFKKKQFV